MWDEPAQSAKPPRLLAALLWLASFWASLVTLTFLNDHFHRISSARQIVRYGELPFRDYFDPGYFLTELSSAALQRLLGDNLLGEALLTTCFIATGTVLVFLLAFRLTASRVASLAASAIALLLLPRAYDYDKVLFYPLAILLCWRFVERPRAPRTWAFALGLVVAALFRYDTGAYIAAAMFVATAVIVAGNWSALGRHLVLQVFAVVCLALPAVAFVHYEGGLENAADQVITYGRRETARTVLSPQRFTMEPAGDAGSPSVGGLARVFTTRNANVLLAYFVRALPLVCAVWILVIVRRGGASRQTIAALASLVTFCVCLNLFILRDPVDARIGGMAGPFAILGAWMAHRAWRSGGGIARIVNRAAVVFILALTIWSVSASADLSHRLQRDVMSREHVAHLFAAWTASPPRFEDMSNRAIVGIAKYLRECTAPTDRVLATWFAPDLFFYAQRGFAGRMATVFGGHWSEPRFERRAIEALAAQPVPIVLTRTSDNRFTEEYPALTGHIEQQYRLGGRSDFGDKEIGKDGYSVWVRNDARPVRKYADTDLPCF